MGVLKCVFVIIGAIIGAGFASGKEIYTFFFVYGEKGIIGIIISFLLIGYIIFKSLKIIKIYEINNYDEFLKIIINKKIFRKLNFEIIINFIINIFLLVTFFIMCAGFSAYFNQEFGINQTITGVIVAIVSYIILNKNSKGIFIINSILIPLIILILIILGTKSYNIPVNYIKISNTSEWFLKSILYASYNSVTLISILIPMRKYIKDKKDIFKITILSIIITIIMAQVIIMLLLSVKSDISNIDLPAVYASRIIWRYIQIFIWYNYFRCNYYYRNLCWIWILK